MDRADRNGRSRADLEQLGALADQIDTDAASAQGRDADPFDRSIDIQISRLRQKLGEDARMPQIIKTVRNGGYVLAGQVTVEPAA